MADRHSATLDHLVLAEMIDSGTYDRHMRRMRLHYRRRRDDLTSALALHPNSPQPGGIRAGLHVVLPLPAHIDEADTVDLLGRAGIAVTGLARYTRETPAPPGLVVGYATPPQHAWRPALDTLAKILSSVT